MLRGHDGRSLMWTTSVGGCSVDAWHRCHGETVAPTSPRASRAIATTNQRPSTRASVLLFIQNVRSARRGSAAGPSGVTSEHLKPILDSARDAAVLPDSRIDGQGFNSRRGVESDPHGRDDTTSEAHRRCARNRSWGHHSEAG